MRTMENPPRYSGRLGVLRLVLAAAIVVAIVGASYQRAAPRGNFAGTASPPGSLPKKGRTLGDDEKYPYGSQRFLAFVADSYGANHAGDAGRFARWFEAAYAKCAVKYPGSERLPLRELLAARLSAIGRLAKREDRAQEELALARWTHKMVKAVIPKFSLDRGYEFVNTVRYGERQCFLQSVLIAGLLQAAGVNAGTEMVYRNIAGEVMNNGHAICLVKLSNGKDVIVDASDPIPLVQQHGLFVRTSGYRFVVPVYEGTTDLIASYRPELGGTGMPTTEVRTLDRPFLMSQFWYYRGERVRGGLINGPKTPAGLRATATALERSVRLSPNNPLAMYMLGRSYLDLGNKAKARSLLEAAHGLYAQDGWVPDGPKEFLAAARR